MAETSRLDSGGKLAELVRVGQLIVGNAEPAEPLGFVLAGPQGSIARPQPAHLAAAGPVGETLFDRSVGICRELVCLARDLRLNSGLAASIETIQELIEGVGEQLH